jgi:hypothetical protein
MRRLMIAILVLAMCGTALGQGMRRVTPPTTYLGKQVKTVGTGGQYATLAAALAAAKSGDVIFLLPGTYAEQGLSTSVPVSIVGADRSACIIASDTAADVYAYLLALGTGSTLSNVTVSRSTGVNARLVELIGTDNVVQDVSFVNGNIALQISPPAASSSGTIIVRNCSHALGTNSSYFAQVSHSTAGSGLPATTGSLPYYHAMTIRIERCTVRGTVTAAGYAFCDRHESGTEPAYELAGNTLDLVGATGAECMTFWTDGAGGAPNADGCVPATVRSCGNRGYFRNGTGNSIVYAANPSATGIKAQPGYEFYSTGDNFYLGGTTPLIVYSSSSSTGRRNYADQMGLVVFSGTRCNIWDMTSGTRAVNKYRQATVRFTDGGDGVVGLPKGPITFTTATWAQTAGTITKGATSTSGLYTITGVSGTPQNVLTISGCTATDTAADLAGYIAVKEVDCRCGASFADTIDADYRVHQVGTAFTGQKLRLKFTCDGSDRTITWGVGFKATAATLVLTASQVTTLDFESDGTNFRQVAAALETAP